MKLWTRNNKIAENILKLRPLGFFKTLRVLLILFILIENIPLLSQDLYDLKHSSEYAEYLYKSNEFKLASREFERILFLDPSNTKAQLQLIKSYRYLNNDSVALSRLIKYYPDFKQVPDNFANEYINLNIRQKKYDLAKEFIKINQSLSQEDNIFYRTVIELYNYNWKKANEIINENQIENIYLRKLKIVSDESLLLKYKSPFLSASLSAIIPGTGKVYSGYWKDGLIAFLFTSLSAWQAYRGFNKNGINSVYGWTYGTIAFGFYMGNIYGSIKAANKFNYHQNHKITDKVENIFNKYIN